MLGTDPICSYFFHEKITRIFQLKISWCKLRPFKEYSFVPTWKIHEDTSQIAICSSGFIRKMMRNLCLGFFVNAVFVVFFRLQTLWSIPETHGAGYPGASPLKNRPSFGALVQWYLLHLRFQLEFYGKKTLIKFK